MDRFHTPVLLEEVVENLKIEKGKKYIDATLGGGGHTFEILRHGGKILGIDVDQEAIEYVEEKLKTQNSKLKTGKLTLARGNFADIDTIAQKHGFEQVSGVLLDIGVSSHQIDTPSRGFSFQADGPLDMRMDIRLGVKAADLVNALTKGELYELFSKLGEGRYARVISESIVSARAVKPIATTVELVVIIEKAIPGRFTEIHKATKAFQALRIAVNDELHSLEDALPKAVSLLESKGRLLVITFHSLEDRIVKNSCKDFEKEGKGKIVTKKPIIPRDEEIEKNKRSRSAKLRVFEKL